jgi:hypothetical protein
MSIFYLLNDFKRCQLHMAFRSSTIFIFYQDRWDIQIYGYKYVFCQEYFPRFNVIFKKF